MPDHLDIVTAQIAGYFVTSVLYGLYLYTFVRCLYVLTRSRSSWKRYSDINWGLVAVTLALFTNGTFNVSLGLLRFIQRFAQHMGPVAWVDAMKLFTVCLQTTIGGGVMIYRCFHVWGRTWAVIIPPLALWLADIGIGLWESWLEWTTHTLLTSNRFSTTAAIFWGLTAAINTYTTGMILYRVWNERNRTRSVMETGNSGQFKRMTRLDSVIRIVIDSGLGYTLVSLTLFSSRVARSNALYITSGADIQAVGIAFNLINIRVADLRNEEQEVIRISYDGNAVISSTGLPIKFAPVSVISYEPSFSNAQVTEEKSGVVVGNDRSLV